MDLRHAEVLIRGEKYAIHFPEITPEARACFADHAIRLTLKATCVVRSSSRRATAMASMFGADCAVASALGVNEDAARKRVGSALEKLAQFFRRRGFKTATSTALAAVLEPTAVSVSAATAALVGNAALQAAPPALAGAGLLLARLASLPSGRRAPAPERRVWQYARRICSLGEVESAAGGNARGQAGAPDDSAKPGTGRGSVEPTRCIAPDNLGSAALGVAPAFLRRLVCYGRCIMVRP